MLLKVVSQIKLRFLLSGTKKVDIVYVNNWVHGTGMCIVLNPNPFVSVFG